MVNFYPPLEAGKYYHIYNRGNNKETIFRENADYVYFLKKWKSHVGAYVSTSCYCLLPNHFHFLIKVENETSVSTVSKAFSNLFNCYAKWFNLKYSRTGSLFQERFRRKEISSHDYFPVVVAYILTNPLRHKIAENFENYPYSSYRELSTNNGSEQQKEEVMRWFLGVENFLIYIAGYAEKLRDIEYKPEYETP